MVDKCRDYHTINPHPHVRNQGPAPTCWAYAAVGLLEAALSLHTGENHDCLLSVQQIITRTPDSQNGSSVQAALSQVIKDGGIQMYEEFDPHEQTDVDLHGNRVSRIHKVAVIRVLDSRETSIPRFLRNFGPIAVLIKSDSLIGYQGGIISRVQLPDTTLANHWVLLVDMTESYWLFRNSYGDDWGERGYFRVANRFMEENVEEFFLAATHVMFEVELQ